MKNSSVLVEDAMVSVDQFEKLVALVPMIAVAPVRSRELLCEPGASVRVVIDRHNVVPGDDGTQDGKLDRKGYDLSASLELGPARQSSRAGVGRDIDVHPKSLGGLLRDRIVRLGQARTIS